jgi:hypothetical protein
LPRCTPLQVHGISPSSRRPAPISGHAYEGSDYASVAVMLAPYYQRHTIDPARHFTSLLAMCCSWRVLRHNGPHNHKASSLPRTFLGSPLIDPVSLQPFTARRGLRFSEAAEKFLAGRQRDSEYALSEQSRAIYATVFRLFDSWGGQPTLEEIDRSRAADFIDAVSSLDPRWGRSPGAKNLSFVDIVSKFGNHPTGLSTLTVNRHPTALGLVWKHAEKRLGFEGKNADTPDEETPRGCQQRQASLCAERSSEAVRAAPYHRVRCGIKPALDHLRWCVVGDAARGNLELDNGRCAGSKRHPYFQCSQGKDGCRGAFRSTARFWRVAS